MAQSSHSFSKMEDLGRKKSHQNQNQNPEGKIPNVGSGAYNKISCYPKALPRPALSAHRGCLLGKCQSMLQLFGTLPQSRYLQNPRVSMATEASSSWLYTIASQGHSVGTLTLIPMAWSQPLFTDLSMLHCPCLPNWEEIERTISLRFSSSSRCLPLGPFRSLSEVLPLQEQGIPSTQDFLLVNKLGAS